MTMPGFNAEASAYRTSIRYYTSRTHLGQSGSISLAQQFCPPSCITTCERLCQKDGLSQSSCTRLCHLDCSAYGTGVPISCGPCVNNAQTCILCGGATVTRSCNLVHCGGNVCSPGAQCCGPHCCPPTCCPEGAHCCSDGDGCCPDGSTCASLFGIHFCIPFVGGLTAQHRQAHVQASH
jgi:hypothetical protein